MSAWKLETVVENVVWMLLLLKSYLTLNITLSFIVEYYSVLHCGANTPETIPGKLYHSSIAFAVRVCAMYVEVAIENIFV